jgi:AcrR family transcriptional regulator
LGDAGSEDMGSNRDSYESHKYREAKSPKRRRSSEERREEIAHATYRLLGQHGIQGTTVSRIADEVGMTAPALYAHFASRYEMLLAAMEPVRERVANWLRTSSNPDMRERLRETGKAHSSYMAAELGFVIPVFEFVLAPRDTDLALRFGKQQQDVLDDIAGLVKQGQEDGTIRSDVDPMLVAWELIIFAWSEDIAHLMGLDHYINAGYSHRILELFIDDMAPANQKRDIANHETTE